MKRIMKILSKGLCLVLALIMSVVAVGCGGGEEVSSDIIGKDTSVVDPASELIYFGTHDYTAPETDDKWLVKNGKTEYKLVVPADTVEANKTEYHLMREEFLLFFARATGVTLQVISDAELIQKEHNENQHYISLDKTTLLKSLEAQGKGIDYSLEEVDYSGGKIVTVDNNIYIVGYTNRGTLNTVYTFLDITFNWECYSANTIVMDEGIENLKLRNYAVHDIPDIQYEPTSNYERPDFALGGDYSFKYPHPTDGGYYYGRRVRSHTITNLQACEIFEGAPEDIDEVEYSQLPKHSGHNSVKVVNYAKYKDSHPKWFGDTNGIQLCYTCNGDEEELDLVTTYLANAIIRSMMANPREQYPHANLFSFTISDDMRMCECVGHFDEEKGEYIPGCTELKAKYDDSGLIVRYLNIVAEKVEQWMEKPENEIYYREDFVVQFMAYYQSEASPAEYNPVTREWQPIDETVKLHDHVQVNFIPIAADYQQSLFSEGNKVTKDYFDGWVACAGDNISYMLFNYNCNYHNYFYDGFDFFETKGMNYLFANGRKSYYAENIHGSTPTEWGALISYLTAKLCYDSTLDSGEIIRNWFDAVYGPASDVMMGYLMSLRAWNHYQLMTTDGYKRRSNRHQVDHLFKWNLEVCNSWIDSVDRAVEMIEPLKYSDPEEYDRIRYNIELEFIFPVFVISAQGMTISEAQRNSIRNRIQENITKYPEYSYVDISGKLIGTWLETF